MMSLSSVSKSSLTVVAATLCAGVIVLEAVTAGQMKLALLGGGIIAFNLLALFWVTMTNRNISRTTEVLSRAAEGQLGARLIDIRGQSALVPMMQTLNRVLDQMEAFAKETDAAMKAAYEGRFYRKILERGLQGEFTRYASSVNTTLDTMATHKSKLAEFETRMLGDAVTISMTVNEGAMANTNFIRNVRIAATETQEMASAAAQVSSGIENISKSTAEAVDLSNRARSLTDETRRSVQSAMSEFSAVEATVDDAARKVSALAAASEAIGEILFSIEEIASQTNLLALNATIEAARAGESGKGFAVVASEVKSLSSQTAKATEDIGARIENLRHEMAGIISTMQRGTEAIANGRQAMEVMNRHMGEVSSIVDRTTTCVNEISTTLSEQASATSHISDSVQHVAEQTKENANSVEISTNALMNVEHEMSSLLSVLADRDIPNKVIMLAKADHVIWKKRIWDVMAGRLTIAENQLSTELTCRLGKWVQGPGQEQFGNDPAFTALEEPHRAVHQNGLEAVRLYNSGQLDAAMERAKAVEEASTRVIACLDRLIASVTKKAA